LLFSTFLPRHQFTTPGSMKSDQLENSGLP
jgi:hypothetical protein